MGRPRLTDEERAKSAERRREYNRRYAREHPADPERKKKSDRRYYLTHREEVHEQHRKWRDRNRGKVQGYYRKYEEENPDALRESSRKYREANPGRAQEWRRQNRDRHRAYGRRRQLRMQQGLPEQTPAEVARALAVYMVAEWLSTTTGEPHHVDHIVPLCLGGLHASWNLRPLPALENQGKRARPPNAEEMAEISFLQVAYGPQIE